MGSDNSDAQNKATGEPQLVLQHFQYYSSVYPSSFDQDAIYVSFLIYTIKRQIIYQKNVNFHTYVVIKIIAVNYKNVHSGRDVDAKK